MDDVQTQLAHGRVLLGKDHRYLEISMTTTLIDLKTRVVTDTGEVVFKHTGLFELVSSGLDIDELPFVDHPDIQKYYRYKGIRADDYAWTDDGEVTGPGPETYGWPTDKVYPLAEMCEAILEERGLGTEYLDRLAQELVMVQERGMEPFFNALCYIRDILVAENITWGAGRGSSCACLILYLLGVHRVDPVKYDIPMQEFFK